MLDKIIEAVLILGCTAGIFTVGVWVYYNSVSYFIDRKNKKNWGE